MKNHLIFILLFIPLVAFTQMGSNKPVPGEFAFKSGEWLKYRMSYSNFLNAGFSTMDVKAIKKGNLDAFHISGKGKSTGIISWFFKVNDDYQTFMYKESLQPYRFIRKINEGGYIKNKEILFDYENKEATVINYKRKTEQKYPISSDIQDMLSTLYYLRNQDVSNLNIGDEIELKLFFDEEINKFKLRYMGKEIIKTKFGKVNSFVFKPLVQSGRVFKENESVTVWISADKNKIPLCIKASLAVGSLRADLDGFKGLAHPFNIIFDN